MESMNRQHFQHDGLTFSCGPRRRASSHCSSAMTPVMPCRCFQLAERSRVTDSRERLPALPTPCLSMTRPSTRKGRMTSQG